MIDFFLASIILCITLYLFAIVIGEELFKIMVNEQVRYLKLIVTYVPLPSHRDIGQLPEPVQRYIAYSTGSDSSPSPDSVRVRYHGKARYGKTGRWMPLGGEAFISFAVPGFWWRATITYFPCIWLDRFDYYIDHKAGMNLNLYSLIPLSNEQSSEMICPALFRYLAFTPLFPGIHRTETSICWDPVDHTAARATITDNGVSAEAFVRFNERGWIESMNLMQDPAGTGYGKPAGLVSCRYSSYAEVHGCHIPKTLEAEFYLPDGVLYNAIYTIETLDYSTCSESGGRGTA